MMRDRADLLELAERIASAEHRVAKLRRRIERLREEGGEAGRDQHTLAALSGALNQLYARQSNMRRMSWAFARH
jgi:hypothetical protein